jgi:hypothetical protein
MGTAGKKQKRPRKFKDKKQSERFKETARKVGADKPSDDFNSLLATLARVAPSLPPEPQIPTSSQLLGINVGGIAMLADGTAWRIAPNDLTRAKGWIPGTEITVTSTDVKKPLWPFKLTNTDAGECVAATRSKPPPK